jgi:hypothetical protein
MEEIAVSEPAATEFVTSEPENKSEEVSLARSQAGPEAPAFIPPNAIPPSGLTPAPAEPEEAPAFVPPEIARRRQAEG